MGSVIRRPPDVGGAGNIEAEVGAPNSVGDNPTDTYSTYVRMGYLGQIQSIFNPFSDALIPFGRKIHAFRMECLSSGSGYVNGFIVSLASGYTNYDSYFTAITTQPGYTVQGSSAIYKGGLAAAPAQWSIADINDSAIIARNVSQTSLTIYEMYEEIWYTEPLTMPTASFPTDAQTITTQFPSLSAVVVSPEAYQLVRLRVDLSSDGTTWPNESGQPAVAGTATFRSSWSAGRNAGTRVQVTPGTRLAQQKWYMRVRGEDVSGNITAWAATTSFTITLAAMPILSTTTPQPSATVTDPFVTRGGIIVASPSDGRQWFLEMQVSKDSTFATGVVNTKGSALNDGSPAAGFQGFPFRSQGNERTDFFYYRNSYDLNKLDYAAEHNIDASKPGNGTWDNDAFIPASGFYQYLSQGIWYQRARSVQADDLNAVSAWSPAVQFVVTHPPVPGSQYPSGKKVILQGVGTKWAFTDPWSFDGQTAYQVQVFTETGTATILDSGKVLTSALTYPFTLPVQYQNIPMRWKVWVWDKDDVKSPDANSPYNTFIVSPTNIVNPSGPINGDIVATGRPTINWNPTLSFQAVQKTKRVLITNTGTGAVVHDSGVISDNVRSYTPPITVLQNAMAYTVRIDLVDSNDLPATTTYNVTTSYQGPTSPIFTLAADGYQSLGYVLVSWTATAADSFFINWKVYRRKLGSLTWTLLQTIEDISVKSYRDYLVPSNSSYQYAVSQTADRSGYALESSLQETSTSLDVYSGDYWIITPGNYAGSVHLFSVKSDSYTPSRESNEQIILGRGRRMSYGTRKGVSGSLGASVRESSSMTATQQVSMLVALQEYGKAAYLRDPFGNVIKVSIGDISVSRIAGVGAREFADITIPYMEIY